MSPNLEASGFWQFMKGMLKKDRGMEVNSEVDERYNLEISTQKDENI